MSGGKDKGDGGKARGVVIEGFAERGGEFCGAIVVEQAEQLRGETGGGFALLKGRLQERLAIRDANRQTASGSGAEGLAFLFDQGLDMGGILDALMAVVAAAVGGNFGGAIEQAHSCLGSNQRQRAA
jgi:hypothetical protein